jgi:hypothetical protein
VLKIFGLVVVILDPARIGRVIWIGRVNVEQKPHAAAIRRRAQPVSFVALLTLRPADDPLQPNLVAHKRALAVKTVTLARLGGRGERIVAPARVICIPLFGRVVLLGIRSAAIVVVRFDNGLIRTIFGWQIR